MDQVQKDIPYLKLAPNSQPDPSGPERVARKIFTTLTALPFVQNIALFGSLAEGSADGWSDVDLWVSCDDVAHTPWIATSAIRHAYPVLFYRMFGNAKQPDGRYWFIHESPFHKLDISFYSCTDYQTLISQPTYLQYPVTSCEVFTRNETATPIPLLTPCHPIDVSSYEREIGSQLYLLLRAIKLYSRGEWERSVVEERYAILCTTVCDMDRSTVMAGGAIGELTYRVIDLVDTCLSSSIDAA